MIFRSILLENYGLFAGRVEFDLAPRTRYRKLRPVILIGGKNGAGKTTILEALRLVLYGRASLGNRVSQNEYELFLDSKIHNGVHETLKADHARVAVTFDHVDQGEQKQYHAERSWMRSERGNITEYLKILENGKPLQDVSSEFWQGFVESLIPERLSQLFFFDGEKIQNLAEETRGSQVLADSIKILLGLDLVERLKADLTIYAAREAKKSGNKEIQKQLVSLEKTISNTENQLHLIKEQQAEVQTTIDGIQADLRKREQRLHRQGHVFADRRQTLKETKAAVTAKIDMLEEKIRQECETTFPFALCPTITQKLQEQLKKEQEVQKAVLVKEEFRRLREELKQVMADKRMQETEEQSQLQQAILATIDSKIALSDKLQNLLLIQDVSKRERQQFSSCLDDAHNRSLPTVRQAGKGLEQARKKLRNIIQELNRGPDEALSETIFQELTTLHQRLGRYEQKKKQLQEEIRKQENILKALQRDHKRLVDRQLSDEKSAQRLEQIKTIQTALDSYLHRLTQKKIDQLCVSVTRGFNLLSRKGDLIKQITIDPKTFTSTLYNHNDEPIAQDKLSSGEKQLYAIAMLWGLARTSSRPLPMIIDTPLSRLDSDHRRNLIHNYFPHASHQIILLSTDTEVDQQLYQELSPHLSHCYHLIYDKKANATRTKEEYFWRDSKACLN